MAQAAPHQTDSLLSREDWIEAALAVLTAEGIEAVKVTRLADRLSVSRGSFYWHFSDRSDLLVECRLAWEKGNTAVMIESLSRCYDLATGILAFFDLWLGHDHFDQRLDAAVRDWARSDPDTETLVKEADDRRIEALNQLYQRAGYPQPEAFIRARVLYFAQIGYHALDIEEPMAQRMSYLEAYYLSFTGRTIDPDVAKAYCQRQQALAKEI